jgi:tyrosyl-tRNA synthetase
MGGNDQWGNIVSGIDLTRRLEEKKVYGITFPLLVTSQGHKMGKTEKGAIWLDAGLTTPYEYFQYWINTEDADIERFLCFFTFLPVEEIGKVRELKDSELNMAKTVLAFEATKITHGEEEAIAAWKASSAAFNLRPVNENLLPSSSVPRSGISGNISAIPTVSKTEEELNPGIPAFELFHDVDLCASRSEARRLIKQGGCYVNDRQILSFDEKIGIDHAENGDEIRLRKGKKKYVLIKITRPSKS